RVAVSAAARNGHEHRIALVEQVLVLGIGRLSVDFQYAGSSRLSAIDAFRWKQRPLGKAGYGHEPLRNAFQKNLLAEAAPVLSRAAAVGAKPLVMKAKRRDMLADLDGG